MRSKQKGVADGGACRLAAELACAASGKCMADGLAAAAAGPCAGGTSPRLRRGDDGDQ